MNKQFYQESFETATATHGIHGLCMVKKSVCCSVLLAAALDCWYDYCCLRQEEEIEQIQVYEVRDSCIDCG